MMEKEEDDILRKYQHSFRNMKGKIHILEQQVPVEEQMRYFRASERWKKNAGGLLPAYDEECNHWFRKLTDQELDGLYELIKDSSNETVIDKSIKS